MTLAPAGADVGIVFSVAGAEIDAHWSRVDASTLRTRLAGDGASVSTVEHVMAALAALRVDNALVVLDGDEVPAMDGSARDFVSAIDEAGVVALTAPRRALRVVKLRRAYPTGPAGRSCGQRKPAFIWMWKSPFPVRSDANAWRLI